MDIPLTTGDAAFGGNPDTGVNPMRGVPTGRFHGWQVQEPPATQSGYPYHHIAPGWESGCAQANAHIRPTLANEPAHLAPVHGAAAVSQVAPGPHALARPLPQLPPLPRSHQYPQADHGTVGASVFGHSRVIAAAPATGPDVPVQEPGHSMSQHRPRTVVPGAGPLDPASPAAAPKTVAEHSNRAFGEPRPDIAMEYRTRVDAALCSLILEAGLGYTEAAALLWDDLKTSEDGSGTITIRKPGIDGNMKVPVSALIIVQLEALRNCRGSDTRIFQLDARQIGNRVRSITQRAGFQAQVPRRPILNTDRDGAPSSRKAPDLRPTVQWFNFVSWCEQKGCASLPASTETTLAYLKERAASVSDRTLVRVKQAIRLQHAHAGLNDPFDDSTVREALKNLRDDRYAPFDNKTFDRRWIDSIRATALQPRPRIRGSEPPDSARHRGLVDIALCSVLHATTLTAEQVAELRWDDLKQIDEDRMQITLRARKDRQRPQPSVTVTGQVVRDLQAIRFDAGTDEKVFNLKAASVRMRVRKATQAAALPAWNTVRPGRTANTGSPGNRECQPAKIESPFPQGQNISLLQEE